MEDLTFGEQVKIILSRRGMTIKELAEKIEEQTGKAMSRQNLTQRLGRDNFQEQDMRMIAAILGCPFHLSIFPMDAAANAQGTESTEDAVRRFMNQQAAKKNRKKKPKTDEEYQQEELVFDEEPTPGEADGEQNDEELSVDESEDWNDGADESTSEDVVAEDERDMTIGELYEIHEELNELEETVQAGESIESVKEEQEAPLPQEEKEAPKAEKKDRFRTGAIFLRRKGNPVPEQKEASREKEAVKEKKPTREVITPDSKDFEPVIKHEDAEEDLSLGEVNPYTGREYQSNSVRMHPTRIGYVQVYDRLQHGWTDMTEWAFLGYQERKKALLGKDYEPPIYLD